MLLSLMSKMNDSHEQLSNLLLNDLKEKTMRRRSTLWPKCINLGI